MFRAAKCLRTSRSCAPSLPKVKSGPRRVCGARFAARILSPQSLNDTIPGNRIRVNESFKLLLPMRHPSQVTPNAFKSSARERLEAFVARNGGDPVQILALTPDASTREYFRIPFRKRRAIAAVYPEPFDPEIHPFLDVSPLLTEANLPVPEILEVDPLDGIIVQEDFGDPQLRRALEGVSDDER